MDLVQIILLTFLGGLIIIIGVFYLQTASFGKNASTSTLQKPTFLILGLNNSGKTSLYYKLIANSADNVSDEVSDVSVSTVSSMEPNITEIKLPFAKSSIGRKFQLIDYPGHLKYSNLLDKLIMEDVTLKEIKGIVYMIDSSSISIKQGELIKSIARILFQLFTKTERLINGIDFAFAINKQDLFDSIPVFKVREMLETEINNLIKEELQSKENKNSGIDQDDENDIDVADYENMRDFWISVVGKGNFKFDLLEGNMDFIGGSVLKNKVDSWENWFDEKVVNQQ